MSYSDKAEITREYYRNQGAVRERQRILEEMKKLVDYRGEALWSPKYIISIIEGKK